MCFSVLIAVVIFKMICVQWIALQGTEIGVWVGGVGGGGGKAAAPITLI